MSVAIWILVFFVSLVAVLGGSDILVRGIDWIGQWLGISRGLLGLLTALGADSPEISSAIVALLSGAKDVGLGVIYGSNLFNLAALIGIGALVAGSVRLHRVRLALHGGAALAVVVLVGALGLHVLSPEVTIGVTLAVLLPYLVVLALGPGQLFRLPSPAGHELALSESEEEEPQGPEPEEEERPDRSPRWAYLAPVALGVVSVGSIGLVQSTFTLAQAIGIPRQYTGIFVLAVLTGLPNLYAAVKLAKRHLSGALVSEALNSNTINLLVGAIIPSLVVGVGPVSYRSTLEFAWLLGMTAFVLLVLVRAEGLTRRWGVAVIVLYLAFVAVRTLS